MRPEDRVLIAPGEPWAGFCTGQKARYVPDLPGTLCCHFSAVTLLSENTGTTASCPRFCYPYSCRDRAESLLQSISQTERYLSFRNRVIGIAVQGFRQERPRRCGRNSRKRRILNVTLTHFWMSPARQPNGHAAQQSRRRALPNEKAHTPKEASE